MGAVQILIADDHELFRRTLRAYSNHEAHGK